MTIHERAIEWAKAVSPWITKYDTARAMDYEIGASEQRKVDIEKMCDLLIEMLNNGLIETRDIGKVNMRIKKAMEE